MSILRRFEREIDDRLRRFFSSPEGESQSKEIVEIHRGILDEVISKIQTLRRGRRSFPYNHLVVHIPVADEERRAVLAMTFVDGEELTADIRDALIEAACDPPPDFRAEVVIDEQEAPSSAPHGFHIVYRRRELEPVAAPAAAPALARLAIVTGSASREAYDLSGGRVNIGRMSEVLDDHDRIVRRNDVVFEEGADPANATVSRAHAHIEFDADSGEYRLFDERSAYGTSLFRGGALIHVPGGSTRGVALRPGDEIYFGRARTRFEARET